MIFDKTNWTYIRNMGSSVWHLTWRIILLVNRAKIKPGFYKVENIFFLTYCGGGGCGGCGAVNTATCKVFWVFSLAAICRLAHMLSCWPPKTLVSSSRLRSLFLLLNFWSKTLSWSTRRLVITSPINRPFIPHYYGYGFLNPVIRLYRVYGETTSIKEMCATTLTIE